MNTSRHRVGCAIRALRYARTSVGAYDKINDHQIVRWDVVACRFGIYAKANMREALREEP